MRRWRQCNSATLAASWRRRQRRWRQREQLGDGAAAAKLDGGAQRDGGSVVAAARMLWRQHAVVAQRSGAFEHHRRDNVRTFILGQGWRDNGTVNVIVIGSD